MALAKLGRYNEHVVALDGDTKNSTFCELFKNEHPNRYVECYIAEQNMVRARCWLSERSDNIQYSHISSIFSEINHLILILFIFLFSFSL